MKAAMRLLTGCVALFTLFQAAPPLTQSSNAIAGATTAPPEGFANSALRARWQQDEQAATASRSSWMWGPGPFYTNYEPEIDLPQGTHLVQYFDKGRLEINDPGADPQSPWFVTSGLLVKEMVSGKAQVGANSYYTLGPANIPVAGDTGSPTAPTYASFAGLTARATNREGQSVTEELSRQGSIRAVTSLPTAVKVARFEQTSGHNWADIFWRYAGAPERPVSWDWLYTLGYPITDPYWVSVPVNGRAQMVLVQLFERRVLTYNPSNPASSQIEMGNAGRHYYNWRYADMRLAELGIKYSVSIAVGAAPQRLTTVHENVEITNGTGQAMTNVTLRAVWHNWDTVFALQSATVSGKDAQTRWLLGINLEVSLPQPLPPGEKTGISLDFTLKPRPIGGRTGDDRSNDILSLGDMLPTVVPWENGGWSFYPYSDLGDLGYYPVSDYDVEVSSAGSERLVVGGTGQITTVNQERTSWRFQAQRVRDVAYLVSPRFVNPLDDPSMTRQVGSVKVLAYFLPGHRAQGQRQLDLVTPSISWFSSRVGTYPFSTDTVAEMGIPLDPTDNYAQEYPMLYLIPTSWLALGVTPGKWTWYTPVHETGHQWFYSTVGNNQLTDPWLDEAMTTYMTTEYIRANYPDLYAQSWASMTAGAQSLRPVSSGVFGGFTSENQYSYTIYDTGAVMLNKVRQAMGDTAFYAAIQDYYKSYSFKIATPAALTATLQKHATTDLTPIFAAYLAR